MKSRTKVFRYHLGYRLINRHYSFGPRKVASGIEIGAPIADSKQTELCTYLSAILLGRLVLNALVGWWWADPVLSLIHI